MKEESIKMNKKSYAELALLSTFLERFEYLKITGTVGQETFGWDRQLVEAFYKSEEWRSVRNKVIIRDEGCDLGCLDHPIPEGDIVIIHHIMPISKEDIINRNLDILLNMDNLISVSLNTHNAIHYGNKSTLRDTSIVERSPNDTSPWLIQKGG